MSLHTLAALYFVLHSDPGRSRKIFLEDIQNYLPMLTFLIRGLCSCW